MGDIEKRLESVVQNMAQTINGVELGDLTEEELNRVAGAVLGDTLKEKLKDEIRIHSIDLEEAIEMFLQDKKSEKTRKLYARRIGEYREWLAGKGLNLLQVGPYEADQYVSFVKTKELAQTTQRSMVDAVSSLYRELERWEHVKVNPFRGAKRPKRETGEKKVPTAEEVQTVLDDLEAGLDNPKRRRRSEMLIPAIRIMAEYGLRIGALPTLLVRKDGTFTGTSKGKEISGRFRPETLNLIRGMGAQPFKGVSEDRIKTAMWEITGKLVKDGKLPHRYSPHALRHYFAVTDYREHRDIYRLMKLLNHSNITVTERYLQSLKVEI